jgi:hypothetical protein
VRAELTTCAYAQSAGTLPARCSFFPSRCNAAEVHVMVCGIGRGLEPSSRAFVCQGEV